MPRSGLQLRVLGARGSMAVCGADTAAFGGNTSCYLVNAGEDSVFLDAGSGLISAPADFPKPPSILLTHLHLDHLLGLGMYPRLSRPGAETFVYLPAREGEDPRRLLDGVYSPPYWPLSLSGYAGQVRVLPFPGSLRQGELLAESMPGSHPGGSLILRLSARGKSLVYATDFEHCEPAFSALAEFARGTDLLLYDGQYSPEEYEQRRGFGHSTPEKGIELMERCGAKRLLLVHHDPGHRDRELEERERLLGRENVRFAREGDVIEL